MNGRLMGPSCALCVCIVCCLAQAYSTNAAVYTLGTEEQDNSVHTVNEPSTFYIQSDRYETGQSYDRMPKGQERLRRKWVDITGSYCCTIKSGADDYLGPAGVDNPDYIKLINRKDRTGLEYMEKINMNEKRCQGRYSVMFGKSTYNVRGDQRFRLTFVCSDPSKTSFLAPWSSPNVMQTEGGTSGHRTSTRVIPVPDVPKETLPKVPARPKALNQQKDGRPSDEGGDGAGLSSPAIAGIVISALLCIGGLAFVVVGLFRRRGQLKGVQSSGIKDEPAGATQFFYSEDGTSYSVQGNSVGPDSVTVSPTLRGRSKIGGVTSVTNPSATYAQSTTDNHSALGGGTSVTFAVAYSGKASRAGSSGLPSTQFRATDGTMSATRKTKASTLSSMFSTVRSLVGYGKAPSHSSTGASMTKTSEEHASSINTASLFGPGTATNTDTSTARTKFQRRKYNV